MSADVTVGVLRRWDNFRVRDHPSGISSVTSNDRWRASRGQFLVAGEMACLQHQSSSPYRQARFYSGIGTGESKDGQTTSHNNRAHKKLCRPLTLIP